MLVDCPDFTMAVVDTQALAVSGGVKGWKVNRVTTKKIAIHAHLTGATGQFT
jgi:hypothetical protein